MRNRNKILIRKIRNRRSVRNMNRTYIELETFIESGTYIESETYVESGTYLESETYVESGTYI